MASRDQVELTPLSIMHIVYVYVYVYGNVHVHVYVYVYVCVYVYVSVHLPVASPPHRMTQLPTAVSRFISGESNRFQSMTVICINPAWVVTICNPAQIELLET